MKNLSRLLFTMLLVLSFSNVNAQDENNPWAVNFGVNAVDVFPVGEDAPQGDFFDEFLNVEDHWNILPSLSTISVSRYIGNGLTAQIGGSLNQIDKWGQFGDEDVSVKVNDLSYYAVDLAARYNITSTKLQPVVGLGGGYTWIEEGPFNTFSNNQGSSNNVGAATLNGSLGLNYWITNSIGVYLESKYKHSFKDYLTKHFQHSAGVAVRFGGKDTDGDGIYDKDDACPEVAGLEAFNGCPDSDGDGIQDSKDGCPQVAGLAEMNGCPDSDGDGVTDARDNCPTVKGLKSMKGCPDADGDGVTDAKDKCPKVVGPASNDGCPDPDTDGDGIKDKNDNCPKVKGTVANKGCPEVKVAPQPDQQVIEKLNSYARIILFDSGKSSFQQQTYQVLQNIQGILQEYPNSNFTIEGHTDSQGSKTSNQALSERRANAVKDYLVSKGISNARLTAYGFGEDYPIDSNATSAGRANNRRTEVKLRK